MTTEEVLIAGWTCLGDTPFFKIVAENRMSEEFRSALQKVTAEKLNGLRLDYIFGPHQQSNRKSTFKVP